MNNLKKYLALASMALLMHFSATAQQQKVGYVDPRAVVSILPSAKAAGETLDNYVKELVPASHQTKVTDFENRIKTLNEKIKAKTISDANRELEQNELAKLQNELATAEQGWSQKIAAKENEVMTPVVKEAGELIDKVAKANGFTLVIDASQGVILYAVDAINLLPLIQAEVNKGS